MHREQVVNTACLSTLQFYPVSINWACFRISFLLVCKHFFVCMNRAVYLGEAGRAWGCKWPSSTPCPPPGPHYYQRIMYTMRAECFWLWNILLLRLHGSWQKCSFKHPAMNQKRPWVRLVAHRCLNHSFILFIWNLTSHVAKLQLYMQKLRWMSLLTSFLLRRFQGYDILIPSRRESIYYLLFLRSVYI